MKKLLLILVFAAMTLVVGCKTVKKSVPVTEVKAGLKAPAREMADIAFMNMLSQAMLVGVISNKEELDAFLVYYYKNRSKFIDIFRRKKMYGVFKYSSPKDTEVKEFEITFDPQEGFRFKADELKTVTNPEIVIAVGDAQAKITAAEGEAFTSAVAEGTKMLEELNENTFINPNANNVVE